MLKLRILSAIFGVPLLLFIVWTGGWLLVAGVVVLAGLGWKEFIGLIENVGLRARGGLGWLVLLFPIVAYLDCSGFIPGGFSYLPVGILLATAFGFIISYPERKLADVAVTLWGILYLGMLFSFWVLVRELNQGCFWIVLALILTWASDTGAYFIGRNWGKRKPWPRLSPGKTLEGALGGLFFCIVTSLALTSTSGFFRWGGPDLGLNVSIVLGLVVSAMAQAGDLVESGLKRSAGVKDSGCLIPGHGGILDRFDSLLFVMPTVYFFVQIYAKYEFFQ
jgi:phosphatidate cytidylyltransferase